LRKVVGLTLGMLAITACSVTSNEDEFVQAAREDNSFDRMTDEALITTGRDVCRQLAEGKSPDAIESAMAPTMPAADTQWLIAAGSEYLCSD